MSMPVSSAPVLEPFPSQMLSRVDQSGRTYPRLSCPLRLPTITQHRIPSNMSQNSIRLGRFALNATPAP